MSFESNGRRPRVAIATLGCKANQYESGRIAADFSARGYDVVDQSEDADLLVINTCTVTNVADQKSRQQIRRLKRRHPGALVIATGCAAEVDHEGRLLETGVDLVIPNREKKDLVAATVTLSGNRGRVFPTFTEDAVPENADACRLPSLGRTRALLMVQDGCGYRCSYCIIPTARPLRVSRPYNDVLEEAASLAGQGYREVVLTGISIGSWRDGGKRLHHIIRAMANIEGLSRIRLSSIEPKTVTGPLIEAFADLPEACHHFHIPLQSGDDATLAAMNRYYDTAYFARLVENIRKRIPDAAFSTDVITGFPNETDAQFERTLQFCKDLDFCKIHVFPFSPRAGTPAATMPDDTGPERRKERTHRLIALSDDHAEQWAMRHVGQVVSVVAEPPDRKTGLYSGLTGNYVRVHWASAQNRHGEIVNVLLETARGGEAYGEEVTG